MRIVTFHRLLLMKNWVQAPMIPDESTQCMVKDEPACYIQLST